jgi:hypothetical protein
MTDISYHHDRNAHSLEGATRGLRYFLSHSSFTSLLDVGAGTGNWLHAARGEGVQDVLGLDGVAPENRPVWVDATILRTVDLRFPFDLERRFDAAICLEVAEHLPPEFARTLICSLCSHSDRIFFSAAAPGQHGEAHLNCQWPSYWQGLFNEFGYVGHDDLRRLMWTDSQIEPWYRQNVFSAVRDPAGAGKEPRICSLIHPEMIPGMDLPESPIAKQYSDLIAGASHPSRYLKLFWLSARHRVRRVLSRAFAS